MCAVFMPWANARMKSDLKKTLSFSVIFSISNPPKILQQIIIAESVRLVLIVKDGDAEIRDIFHNAIDFSGGEVLRRKQGFILFHVWLLLPVSPIGQRLLSS